ncbi:Ecdysteroid UDP-glucosyltransferase [Harpegnathos saltator]|uniref:Ecdysteroid UDP-glucosyltransferase n=2 Tax=Harpegnathos saltator TaxID=610380 RepID=E2BS79_HARSA|nr:Ecdysteroid UDP-glucosyltransferase [Harpegnathos saltator]
MNLPYLYQERILWEAANFMNYELFVHPEIKKLYAANSNEQFDAVIIEQGVNPSLNAFAYRFKAPLIGISSLDVYNQVRYMMGGLVLPSHRSSWQTNMQGNIESNMSFWDRLVNFCEVWYQIYNWMNVRIPLEDALVRKYLGEGIPSVADLSRNISLFLVNRHPTIAIPRQEQSNVVFYHGFHIKRVLPALPNELKQYLDNAKNGFIYVSLGTNVVWKELPPNIFNSFVEALASLPWKVLWKNNPDIMPRKFENILVSKWFPQQSILAHPNIKLFIYQGGLQSTEETIYHGVPIIGFPVIWDQKHQVRHIVKLGIGLQCQITNISKEDIVAAVHEVISNKRYKERVKELSKLYTDIPYDSLQNAAWWVEYVMRHNGITNWQDEIADEPWYQRYDWDVISFLAVTAFTTSLICLYALLQILHRIYYRLFRNETEFYYVTKPKSQ